MKTNFEKILDFQAGVDAPAPAEPTVPDNAILKVRRNLVQEEFDETMAAMDTLEAGDVTADSQAFTAVVSELVDLLYVTYGSLAACGVDADAIFDAIHSANMRKLGGPRRADGKQLKPAGWQPADVTALIHKMKNKHL